MTTETIGDTRRLQDTRLPWAGLLALFFAGFLSIINETTPAGLLPEIAATLHVTEAVAGQTVTVYALATAVSAVPLSIALRRWGRRTLLVTALAAFVVSNLAIAVTDDFAVILVARFVAGVGAGLVWTNLAAAAARLVSERHQGRAMSIANAGTPVALSLGLPVGTLLGSTTGWHFTFAATGIAGAATIVWVLIALPALPAVVVPRQPRGERPRSRFLRGAPGVLTILAVMSGFFLAHNVLYTYIAALVDTAGIASQVEWVLLSFGVAAFVSILVTGLWIDRHHRHLTVGGLLLLAAAFLLLGFVTVSPVLVYVAAVLWGLGFGGGATWFLTAGFRAAGSDSIAAVMVTLVNAMIGAGALVGGALIGAFGTGSLSWVAFAVMVPSAIAAIVARRHAFPPTGGRGA